MPRTKAVAEREEPNGGTELTQVSFNENYIDAFEEFGNSGSNQNIKGTLLKFSKGDWLAGQDNDAIEEGTELVAMMDFLAKGWIKWVDSTPVRQVIGLVKDRFVPPERAELGDMNEDEWEVDQNGKPRDPWQPTVYLILKEPGVRADTDHLYTFATSSKGGRDATTNLAREYSQHMRQRGPSEYPVVALGVSSYLHKEKAFGRIKFPVFMVTGWEDVSVSREGPTEKPVKKAPPKPAPKQAKANSRR